MAELQGQLKDQQQQTHLADEEKTALVDSLYRQAERLQEARTRIEQLEVEIVEIKEQVIFKKKKKKKKKKTKSLSFSNVKRISRLFLS